MALHNFVHEKLKGVGCILEAEGYSVEFEHPKGFVIAAVFETSSGAPGIW